MDIMETRFTDSFPSLSLSLYNIIYTFPFLSVTSFDFFLFSSLPPHPPSPSSLSTGSEKQSNGTLVSLFSLGQSQGLSLSHTIRNDGREKKKLWCVCPADSIQHLCASACLPACLSLLHVPHGFHIDQTLPNFCRTTSLALSLSLSSLKFWE